MWHKLELRFTRVPIYLGGKRFLTSNDLEDRKILHTLSHISSDSILKSLFPSQRRTLVKSLDIFSSIPFQQLCERVRRFLDCLNFETLKHNQ